MKKLFTLLCAFCTLAAFGQIEFALNVEGTDAGYVSDKEVDLNAYGETDIITIHLDVTGNTGFDFSAFEIAVKFPKYLVLLDTNQLSTSNSPFAVDTTASGFATTNIQPLPAGSDGAQTSATFDNFDGTARIGAVVTNPSDRVAERDFRLATFRFRLGRGMWADLTERSLDTCRSFGEKIQLVISGNEKGIIANEAASAVTFSTDVNVATVLLSDTSLTSPRGDVTLNGSATATDDLIGAVWCLIFGTNDGGCPLAGQTDDVKMRALDCDCGGSITSTSDLLQAVLIILKLSRSADGVSKRHNESVASLNGEGVINVDTPGKGVIATGEIRSNGLVDGLYISDEARANGWVLVSEYISNDDVFIYAVLNASMTTGAIPTVMVDYQSKTAKTSLKVSNSTVYTRDNKITSVTNKIH